ncbi:MAG TPA: restriction endonuclease [Nitrososphaerales archaeon]|nr:restriction endonuclease [Nitrososphaerales archaeon]
MAFQEQTLISLLSRKANSPGKRNRVLKDSARDLGFGEEMVLDPVCVAYALLKLDVQLDEVSRLLTWKDFERLAGALFRAAGYQVKENLYLRKPRAQIDLVAYGPSTILAVDCKHWGRGVPGSTFRKAAQDQLKRCEMLRRKLDDSRPIGAMILALSPPEGTFVEGVPVVPVRTLRSFLGELESYASLMEFR